MINFINKIKLTALLLIILMAAVNTCGQKVKKVAVDPADIPYAQYFSVKDFINYNPSLDINAPYNKSTVGLSERFCNPAVQFNPHARTGEGKVTVLPVFRGGKIPAQGIANIKEMYPYSFWQYTDILVYWGGGPGTAGINVVIPSACVVDAAHRNGVPVVSNVFFPPAEYGGKIDWVKEFLVKSGDTYPAADKMIETAKYFGFDGWFINQETPGGDEALAASMKDFMKYIKSKSNLIVYWYDAMIQKGNVDWQGGLNGNNSQFFQDGDSKVSDYMFIDFRWNSASLANSKTYAGNIGRSSYQLYAGIDCAVNGYNTQVNWNGIFPEGQPHVMGMGFYRPDDFLWWQAGSIEENYKREIRFWSGANGDPSNTNGAASWKGVAHYIPANSSVNSLPFSTSFCTGAGYNYYMDGKKLSSQVTMPDGWNNLSLQNILPTWRWIVESSGEKLTPSFDWSDAYNGGNCLKISGNLTSANTIKLYQAKLKVSSNTKLDVVFKTGKKEPANMKLAAAFEDNPSQYEYFDIGTPESESWNTKSINLGSYSGKTIAVIALYFEGANINGYEIKVGQISLYNGTISKPSAPSNISIEKKTDETGYLTLRLKWEPSSDKTDHYNIYRKNPDNSLTYLGGTPGTAYFVQRIDRIAGDTETGQLLIEAVAPDNGVSDKTALNFSWSSAPPKAVNPSPSTGALNVPRNPVLSWISNGAATAHDVYLSKSNPPDLYLANLTKTNLSIPSLEPNTVYFWRVDEKNQEYVTQGDVWSFTTGPNFNDTSGAALEFDGTDDYVNCGKGSNLNIAGLNITLEAWINAKQFKEQIWQGVIIAKDFTGGYGYDYGYSLRCGAQGQVDFLLGNGYWENIESPVNTIKLNKWHHVAATYNGSVIRLFVDSVEVASKTKGLSIKGNTNPLLIGESSAFRGRVFNGKIDEVRIWNKARSKEQILNTMYSKLDERYCASPDSGLAGFWRFEEKKGQTAADIAFYKSDGILGSGANTDASDPKWIISDIVLPVQTIKTPLPLNCFLAQNYPNPFNPETVIKYQIPNSGLVTLKVYNTLGQEMTTLVNDSLTRGEYSVPFKKTGLASGVYFYRLSFAAQADGKMYSESRKMILTK